MRTISQDFDDKKGGSGWCQYCNQFVSNISLHGCICNDHPKNKNIKRTCPLCKGTGIINEIKDGRLTIDGSNCESKQCEVCEGKGIVK